MYQHSFIISYPLHTSSLTCYSITPTLSFHIFSYILFILHLCSERIGWVSLKMGKEKRNALID